jgi:MerR family transcriptional regulator, copper efflux regulator
MLTTGQLARAAVSTAKTIRYYEEVGVLPPAPRNGSGYR